jgi:hypothetical protein
MFVMKLNDQPYDQPLVPEPHVHLTMHTTLQIITPTFYISLTNNFGFLIETRTFLYESRLQFLFIYLIVM